MTVMRTLCMVFVLVATVLLSAVAAEEDAVFPIQEGSMLDEDGNLRADYLRYGGAGIFGGPCGKTPARNVTYPTLKSESPLYGQVVFRTSLDASPGAREYCFVLDATGADASKYDVLYFDANQDQDLTNDAKLVIAEKPPKGLSPAGITGDAVRIFDCLELKGSQREGRTERFLPWLTMQNRPQPYMIFLSTVVRTGKIRIGQQSYEVLLGSRSQGRGATVWLKSENATSSVSSKSVTLDTLQQVGDEFFTMSVDAPGEQLTVSPYRGEYGQLSIKTGENAPQKAGIAAILYKQDRSTFNLGDFMRRICRGSTEFRWGITSPTCMSTTVMCGWLCQARGTTCRFAMANRLKYSWPKSRP